jgi:hypothetical protein
VTQSKRTFRDWSIRRKLTALFMVIASFTAAAVSLPMCVYDVIAFKRAMVQDLATLGDVVAGNSTAALTFRDSQAARDVLQGLRAEPNVTAACIYTADGLPFAKYVRDGRESEFLPPLPQAVASNFEGERLIQFRRITLAGETVGTLYLESDLERLHARLRSYNITFSGCCCSLSRPLF